MSENGGGGVGPRYGAYLHGLFPSLPSFSVSFILLFYPSSLPVAFPFFFLFSVALLAFIGSRKAHAGSRPHTSQFGLSLLFFWEGGGEC